MKIITSAISPETAYLVTDYPYGFRLRCQIRYWLEFKKGKGVRFVSQTTNPKRPGIVWNKPKASTYCEFGGAMFLDENGHVQWSGLNMYAEVAEMKAWRDTFGAGQHPACEETFAHYLRLKEVYEAEKALGTDYQHAGLIASLHVNKGKTLEQAREIVRAMVAKRDAAKAPVSAPVQTVGEVASSIAAVTCAEDGPTPQSS